MLLKVGDKNRY